jgi:hypothetical protein
MYALKAKKTDDENRWYCHCCLQSNTNLTDICKTCGRHESYAEEGYQLPLHGQGGKIFRPSQIIHVLQNVNEVDEAMWTPLHSACVQNNVATVKKLLELSCEINAKNDKGQTALHLAIYAGSSEIVKILLASPLGADVTVATINELDTPLHMACEGGYRSIAYALLDAGADFDVPNKMERTPLHLAALCGRADIGSMLLRAGANANAVDIHGWNARQLAELRGHREFQELIVRATMTEKMAVIKEMPPAPWHCELWNEVTNSHQQSIINESKEKETWDKTVIEVNIARQRAIDEKAGAAEVQRLKNLEIRKLEREARERAREELAAQILGSHADIQDETAAVEAEKKRLMKTGRAKPPPGLLGLDKWGNKIDRK